MTTAPAPAQPEAGPSSTSASASALTPALFKRLHPRPYLDKFLGEGVRPDGRLLASDSADLGADAGWRDASINVGKAQSIRGLATVDFGETCRDRHLTASYTRCSLSEH